MNRTTFQNIDLRESADLVITEDNLMSIGEKITFNAFQRVERYYYVNLGFYSKGMYKNVMHLNTEETLDETLSDGYEIMQECMIYLCNFLGKKLGDTYKIEKGGKIVTIYLAALRFTAKYIKHYIGIYDEPVSELNENIPYRNTAFTEEDYDRADAIVENMHLSEKQNAVLNCYVRNMRPKDMSAELNISASLICNTRKRLQKLYLINIAHYDF